ncbi:hypothetical protein TRICI_002721 [Trichomonascus ciferrii]|uniref:ENTH domain-containing protein n=1 Tax=Trichomonascus ciferrii TaxID=44093 RepID=A0A642VBQ4_9ASCO|nr:hypothetical protein TRICI_002721 [Trichomonascus ciferrii]
MDMIDRRLNDKGKNWRHVMKALTLLDYIIHYGSENVVLWSKDNLYIIKTLREFQYIDEEGRDQGANIRAKARELTSLLQDDDRLRAERTSKNGRRGRRRGSSRPPPPTRPPLSGSNTGRSNRRGSPTDSDLQRALEESRLTAEEEERRRRQMMATQSDTDLQKALKLSKEEEQYRGQLSQNNILFDSANNNNSQPNLIDTSDVWQPQTQPQFVQQQPPPQFFQQQQQQPMVTGMMPQQQQQVDLFGNPIQQPMATGMLQNAYATGGQFPQQQFAQPQQQPEPQPLQPLKTGSNNPFAKQNQQQQSTGPTQPSSQSLSQLSNGGQPPLQQTTTGGGLKPQRTNNFDNQHMSELNTLLATGDGIDTFGNVGDLRIPAQHTKSTYVNSAGQGLTTQPTNNPFMAQYTGVATTNQIQPAFTGYGFGNAQQSQQSYQQQQQKQNNNLIDL